ncbi:hypothetical protein BOTBODRAFT_174402 [Botryobasidium botryosum FD-172 SS1]|uniref:DUF7918 domain-containing protein n=1 Tax=Botryobasidium botryosum (strain FD-172 SS1) TaxID=930990 RepID=A0A067MTK8_BOTB1|nr:hypothetical protein BOTBODRAFT_174402 [Botryobasidium botryosum FD-172 SS1]
MPIYHCDFSAWITSEGSELAVYQTTVEGNNGRTISCWIPSSEGKKFKVHWKDHKGGIATLGEIFFDGSSKGEAGTIIHGRKQGETVIQAGLSTSERSIKPFIFARLHVTDDDFAAPIVPSEIGSIKLTIKRVIVQQTSMPPRFKQPKQRLKTVHEKSKKAGLHIVSYGEKMRLKTNARMYTNTPYDPSDTEPWVTFIFKYRPLDWLQAEGIAPPTARDGPSRKGVRATQYDDEAAINTEADEICALEAGYLRITW